MKENSDKKLQEKDIRNLPCLKIIIKESVKLHPTLPFLVPHMAMDYYKMLGYYKRSTNPSQCLGIWTGGIYGFLGYFLMWGPSL